MAIDTTKKIKQVTYNGTEIPLRGYDTSDATVTAGDMASGVIGYGKNGKVTGNVDTIKSTSSAIWKNSEVTFVNGGEEFQFLRQNTFGDKLFRKGSKIALRAMSSNFGTATAADVAKGKTFTSASGLKVAGTAEIGDSTVTFELENNFGNLAVVCMTKVDGVLEKTIEYGSHQSITVSKGSMVILVDKDFGGDTIDVVPDNSVKINQGWRTTNVTMFVAGAETNGMWIVMERV